MSPQQTGMSTTSSIGDNNLIDARLQRLKLEGTPRIKRERRMPAPPMSPIPLTADFSDFMLSMQHTGGSGDPGSAGVESADAPGGDAFGPGGMVGERSSLGSQNGGAVDYGSLARKMMDDLFAGGTRGLTEFGGVGPAAGSASAEAEESASPSKPPRSARRSRTEVSLNDEAGSAAQEQDDDLPGSMRRPPRRATSRSARPSTFSEEADANDDDGHDSPTSPSPNPYSLAQPRNITPMSIPEGLLWTLREDDAPEEQDEASPVEKGATPGGLEDQVAEQKDTEEKMEVLSPVKGKHEEDD